MADRQVKLGFCDIQVPTGTHICQIYRDEEERDNALVEFLLQGLRDCECSACFSHNFSDEMLQTYLARHNFSFEASVKSGALSLAEAESVYFRNGRFEPAVLLDSLADFHSCSVKAGYPGARVIGEMVPEILHRPGGERLMEYEARVSLLMREHPITTVCQYDARAFSGSTIMDILKVHPMMVVRGAVIHNPFFIRPEDILGI